jgi:hypothetical protein
MLRQRVNDGDRLAKLSTEEPDALIAHVRICGESARVTSPVYPTNNTPRIGVSYSACLTARLTVL